MSQRWDDISVQYAADLHRQGEVETAAAPARKPRRWIGRLVGLMFVGMCVGAALVAVIKFVNDPAQAQVSAATVKASIAPTPVPNGTLNGLAMTLQYPGKFNQVTPVKGDVTATEQYNLGSSTSYRRTITVDVKPYTEATPHDDSNYRLRELQPDTYKLTPVTLGGEPVFLVDKADGTEADFFWPHKGKLLIVAVTSTELGDHANDFRQIILPSVRWK